MKQKCLYRTSICMTAQVSPTRVAQLSSFFFTSSQPPFVNSGTLQHNRYRSMSKLRLLGSVLLRSEASTPAPFRRTSAVLRSFSTDSQSQDSCIDPFLQTPEEGLVYGRLNGNFRNTLKTDIIHYLEGSNISPEDIKVEYSRVYNAVGMLLQFKSQSSYETALRQIIRKGRLYKLDKIDRSRWDITESFNGKAVLLQEVPRNAIQEDVERFLSGCNYDPASFQTFIRPGTPEPVRVTLVKFATPLDAMNAFITKNRSFCQNSPVTMRVLQ